MRKLFFKTRFILTFSEEYPLWLSCQSWYDSYSIFKQVRDQSISYPFSVRGYSKSNIDISCPLPPSLRSIVIY